MIIRCLVVTECNIRWHRCDHMNVNQFSTVIVRWGTIGTTIRGVDNILSNKHNKRVSKIMCVFIIHLSLLFNKHCSCVWYKLY